MSAKYRPTQKWIGRTDREDGEHALRLHHLVKGDATRAIIGFCSEAGVARNLGRPGAKHGPMALRQAMANLSAPADPLYFSDLGDIDVEGDALEAGHAMLAKAVTSALKKADRLVVLGGGHETAFGSYSGLRGAHPDARIGIINLDAHLDLRLPSERGVSSGTPFTQIRELDPDKFDYACLGVAEESNTQALHRRAKDWGVDTVSDHALLQDPNAADSIIDAIVQRNDIVYLTIDIDVMPHYQAPGVSAPAARGVPFATIEYLVDTVLTACDQYNTPCPLADLVELSPPNDIQGMTAKSAALLIRTILLRR